MNIRISRLFIGLALTVCMMASSTTVAAIRYVKAGGTGSGTSWTNASGNLQTAINNSGNNDEVWVALGTYKPGTATTSTFSLKNKVRVIGGFYGTPGSEGNPNARDPNPSTNSTVLSGDIGTTSVATDNSYHVVTASGVENTALLDGFTIRDGYANGSTTDHRVGAGITITGIDSSPQIFNCIIENNTAMSASVGQGGGLASRSTNNTLVLTNCLFQNNSAELSGGAIYSANPELLDIQECTFIANSNTSTAAPSNQHTRGGGAIHCFGNDPETQQLIIRDSSFTLNQTASGNGGAIYGGIRERHSGHSTLLT